MIVRKNIHAIWVSYNGWIPDQVISNLIAWRKMLPDNWNLYLWTNRTSIQQQYLAYLSNYCTIMDIRGIISKTPHYVQEKLDFFLENGQKNKFLFARLFSDIFRLLIMTIEDDMKIFSGIYIDAGDTFFTRHTQQKLDNLELLHGFAFGFKSANFDSNVTIFSPLSEFNTDAHVARQIIAIYFLRLAKWSIEHLQQIKFSLNLVAITNIINLFKFNYWTKNTLLITGHTLPTEEISADNLLELDGSTGLKKYNKHNLTYTLFNDLNSACKSYKPKLPTIPQVNIKIPNNIDYNKIPGDIPFADPLMIIQSEQQKSKIKKPSTIYKIKKGSSLRGLSITASTHEGKLSAQALL